MWIHWGDLYSPWLSFWNPISWYMLSPWTAALASTNGLRTRGQTSTWDSESLISTGARKTAPGDTSHHLLLNRVSSSPMLPSGTSPSLPPLFWLTSQKSLHYRWPWQWVWPPGCVQTIFGLDEPEFNKFWQSRDYFTLPQVILTPLQSWEVTLHMTPLFPP